MNPVKIIETFLEKGIILSAEENQLRFNAPVGTLTAELRQILTENKQAILQHLQKRPIDSATPIPELRPNLACPPIPLSFAQQRLWFLEQWEPGGTTYLQTHGWRLQGSLDPGALEASVNALAARQDSLRTSFPSIADGPVQVIGPPTFISLPLHDLTALSESDREEQLQRLIHHDTQQAFDLPLGPLWRAQLIRLGTEVHVFLFSIHHIITDGWSMRIIWKELGALYSAHLAGQPASLPPLPLQYADFAVWQRQWLQGEVLQRQLTYWRTQLAEAPPSLELPTKGPRPPQQTYRGERLPFTLPVPLTQALKTLSHQEGVTLFMVLLAAFQILLFRYTDQRDILVGAPIAGRTHTDLEGLIGFFVNTLVLRTQFKSQPTFRDVLRQVRKTCLDAYAHQDLPFEKLVEVLQPARDLSRHPLFQFMFQLFSQPNPDFSLPGLHVTPESISHQSAKFDLNCTLRETADSLEGTMEYCTDLFTLDTIQRMVCHYQHLLEGIVANPDQQIATLPILLKAERQQLLVQGTNTSRNSPPHTCVSELFEAQVTRTPEAIAVVFEEQQLTYRELNARANQLAHVLRGRGVGPDVRVGLCLERGVELITSLLGILKAGGAYVPLDPTYPEERLRYILTDSNPHCIVTQHGLIQGLEDIACPRIYLDRDWAFCAPFSVQNILSSNTGLSMAYLIYTSGSTGQPKGVMVTHEAVINLLLTLQEHVGVDQTAVILAVTSLSFDISVFELLGPLIVGGRLVLTSREDVTDGVALIAALQSHGITVMQATPTTWHMLLQASHTTPLGSLGIICGGEPMPTDLARRLQPWGSKILNAYGPTETTIWSTIFEVESPEDRIPIGWPLANTTVFLIDSVGELVPMCVAGEILIGGDGVARGYHRRPDLTAEKFMPDAFGTSPGERLYKTGDLARYRPDSSLDCLGRLDHQVKIRGFRIELGEIEAALIHHPAVHDAVVLCREDSPGSKQLVGYVVVADTRRPSTTDLVVWLKRTLPDYMLPSMFVLLETLTLTPNGKVDRRALPVPDPTHRARTAAYVPPRTPVEELVAEMWQDLLKVDHISVHDNFFALGGHSLLATQVIGRLRNMLELDLPLRTLFEHPTVAQLAKEIDMQLANNFPDWPKDESETLPNNNA